jgi:hypothetical protein
MTNTNREREEKYNLYNIDSHTRSSSEHPQQI